MDDASTNATVSYADVALHLDDVPVPSVSYVCANIDNTLTNRNGATIAVGNLIDDLAKFPRS